MSALFSYHGRLYPQYIREGNAMQFIEPVAKKFCIGRGVDVGGGKWPLPWAEAVVDQGAGGGSALEIPAIDGGWDFVFSSHCLEHLDDPIRALEHWKLRLRPEGVLFLYLPHPHMEYWRPENCRKHKHLFHPNDTSAMLRRLGFLNVLHSERDLAWSFSVVAFNPREQA